MGSWVPKELPCESHHLKLKRNAGEPEHPETDGRADGSQKQIEADSSVVFHTLILSIEVASKPFFYYQAIGKFPYAA